MPRIEFRFGEECSKGYWEDYVCVWSKILRQCDICGVNIVEERYEFKYNKDAWFECKMHEGSGGYLDSEPNLKCMEMRAFMRMVKDGARL